MLRLESDEVEEFEEFGGSGALGSMYVLKRVTFEGSETFKANNKLITLPNVSLPNTINTVFLFTSTAINLIQLITVQIYICT
jgi:hypothetical protein